MTTHFGYVDSVNLDGASIVKAIQGGVMVGMTKDGGKPDNPFTREQLAVILDRLGFTLSNRSIVCICERRNLK